MVHLRGEYDFRRSSCFIVLFTLARARAYFYDATLFRICFNTTATDECRHRRLVLSSRRDGRAIVRGVVSGSPHFQPVVKPGTPGMDRLWGPTRALERCDAPGWTDERTTESCKRAKTLISDISNFYEASLENISTDCAERVLSRRCTDVVSIATFPGRDFVLARLINASRDRKLTPAFPSLPFRRYLFSFSFSVPLSLSLYLPLAPPESVSRTRKEALSGVKW